jgi:Putative serine esterase (DUF676)
LLKVEALSMAVIITLVHGTWSQTSEWTREGSRLRTAFNAARKDRIIFRTFVWSGRNSFAARETAAEDLRAFLREGFQLFPDAAHSVIAHSHGGNIVLKALEDGSIRERVINVICLSTPFITVAPRNFGSSIGFNTNVFHWGLAVLAAIWVVWKIAFLRTFCAYSFLPTTSNFIRMAFLLMFGVLALIAYGLIYYPANQWRTYVGKFTNMQTIRPVSDLKLLVIRPPADEATGALTATQFFAWLATRSWQVVALIQTWLRSLLDKWSAWSKRHRVWSYLLALGITALSLWRDRRDFVANLHPKWVEGPIVFAGTAFMIRLVYVPIIIYFFLIVSTLILALLILPLIVVLSLAVTPFSPLDTFLMGPLQIAAEAAPVGRCEILQLPSTGAAGFMHSSTYENPLAIKECFAWILLEHDSPNQRTALAQSARNTLG